MAAPSWLTGLYGPVGQGATTPTPPPASLTVLTPQQSPILSSTPPTPPQLGEERRTPSVF